MRNALSDSRRKEAEEKLYNHLWTLLEGETVLSFQSISSEIDTHELNHALARADRLLLPRIFGNTLEIYHVNDLTKLTKSSHGVMEPNPANCEKATKWSCALIPALAFDWRGYRLGWGKGHYDIFLSDHSSAQTIGIGFTEQLVDSLPREPHDIRLGQVYTY